MKVLTTKAELSKSLEQIKAEKSVVGFVPTMGALHEGHISLVKKAGEESDFVVVSIFVNPTQFNNKEDLKRYPRDLDKDLKLLEKTSCNIVFAPSVEEMYPEEDTRVFNFGSLETVMEGKFRPGHFNGVAQVVSKLFDAVKPDKAFFGLKDFQQLAIIRKMTEMLNLDVDIIPCPIIRETSGLAMSSRNMLLSSEERDAAALISATLFAAVKKSRNFSVDDIKQWVIDIINANSFLETEYFDIVDEINLQTVKSWDEKVNKIGCIAVHCGKVRLIDNVNF
jgi:pantoate--beta-alanine ligase